MLFFFKEKIMNKIKATAAAALTVYAVIIKLPFPQADMRRFCLIIFDKKLQTKNNVIYKIHFILCSGAIRFSPRSFIDKKIKVCYNLF